MLSDKRDRLKVSSRNGIRIEREAGNAVYLDYAATTPVDRRVIAAMSRCLGIDGVFGNAETGRFDWLRSKNIAKGKHQ